MNRSERDPEEILSTALAQVENLTILLEDNEYKTFLYNHLIPIKYELQRQLNNLTNTSPYSKIDE
jgi:hypothetical protein